MFVGRHARSLDRKGRLAIPAEYLNRLEPGERDEIYVTPGENGCIWLLPKGYYSAVAAKVEEDDDDEIADLFFHYSQLRTIDKAGRLLLDEGAREFADLPDPSGDDKVTADVSDRVHVFRSDESGRTDQRKIVGHFVVGD